MADGASVHVVRAPAKLTLSLRVLGRRPDGYHDIEAEVVSLQLADELEFGEGSGVEFRGPEAMRMAAAPDAGPDLIERALAACGRQAHVVVEKRIPVGGGLGGGSSDAAAVLRWAGVTDRVLAASLGADVPFCVAGGRALVRGIGEIVEPLADEPRDVVLVLLPFGVSTAAVFAAWDAHGRPADAVGNDLEHAAIAVDPRLGAWKEALLRCTGNVPRLAGSGSTWFYEARAEELGLEDGQELDVGGMRGRIVQTATAVPIGIPPSA